tara:strand:- start:137 stop:349 length:213 start_codon:yes stop_codon:yes gene_type:complete
MPKYTIRQSYLTEDVYKNVEGKDVQDAIDNIVVLTLIPSDTHTEDTETKVELEQEQEQRLPYYYGERKKV